MKRFISLVILMLCGCGGGPPPPPAHLAEAFQLCNASKQAGEGRPMTAAEWNDLITKHEDFRDEGWSRNNAIVLGNETCHPDVRTECSACNVALVNALWP